MRYLLLLSLAILLAMFGTCFAVDFANISDAERVSAEFSLLFDRDNDFSNSKDIIIKSGTPFLLDIIEHKDLLTSEQRAILREKLVRPSLPDYYDTPDGHFKIHFNSSLSDTHYVHRCGEFFMRAWAVEVDTFGFNAPISDGALGGDGRFDVYIMNLGAGVYGVTYPDGNEGPNPWHDESAYIEVNISYDGFPDNDDPEGSAWGAFKVTCAHEFFHGVQMGYDPDEDVWMLEIASVWMEDMVYNYVNDYYNYLSGYYTYIFDSPYLSLMEYSMHMYSSCIWFRYLSENYTVDIINEIFNNMIYFDGMNAISAALDSIGLNVGDEFSKFACWNYLTSSLADDYHYEEAAGYPPIAVEASVSSYPYTFYPVSSHRPHSFGANYIELLSTPEHGIFIDFSGAAGPDWEIAVVVPGDSAEIFYPNDSDYVNTHGLPAAVVVAPIGSFTSSSTTYDFSITIRECLSIAEKTKKPKNIEFSAYPNPFNSSVKITISTPSVSPPYQGGDVLPINRDGGADIAIYDLRGNVVVGATRWVAQQEGDATHRPYIWHPDKNISSGIYLVKAKMEDGRTMTKRIVYLK